MENDASKVYPGDTFASLRTDLNSRRPYSASAHPLEQQSRLRHVAPNPKPSFSSPQEDEGYRSAVYGRRRSIHTSQGHYNSSPLIQRLGPTKREENNSRIGMDDGTESTVSTTAPSTVWDELDDLKARIRKIEITGQLPSTSDAAMSTTYRERPATASTTLTIASISPKRSKMASLSPEDSTVPNHVNSQVHPLLQSALAKAKSKLDHPLFKALEASTIDALALTAITSGKTFQGAASENPTAFSVDRQLRRKADNLCRSLTELCLALAEERDTPLGMQRTLENGSHGDSTLTSPTATSRQPQEEDPDLAASSRLLNRLEARRTSLRSGVDSGPQSTSNSPQQEARSAAHIERATSLLRRRDEDNAPDTNRRPLSRAATDAGSRRPEVQSRSPREYTSTHPLPSPPKGLAPGQIDAFARKTYFPSTQSAVSSVNGSTRSPIQRSSPTFTDSTRLAKARQRRLASLGYGSSPSTAASSRRLLQVGADQG